MDREIFVYISLPIGNGLWPTDEQFADAKNRAATIEAQITKHGLKVINPTKLGFTATMGYTSVLEIAINTLITKASAVFFCANWQDSYGCRQEFEAAHSCRKRIFLEDSGDINHIEEYAHEVLNKNQNYFR